MDTNHYDSLNEASEGIEKRLGEDVRRELFEAVEDAVEAIINEYDLNSEVSENALQEQMQIGYAESISDFVDEGVRDVEGIRELIAEIRREPVENSKTVVGKMGSRSRDVNRVSRAMWERRE